MLARRARVPKRSFPIASGSSPGYDSGAVERSIEILTALSLIIIGLSHVLQPRVWAYGMAV